MALEYLTMEITYNIEEDTYKIGCTVAEHAQEEILSNFLRAQIGAGFDPSKGIQKEIYQINIRWHMKMNLDVIMTQEIKGYGMVY